jgi:hypothetical protein
MVNIEEILEPVTSEEDLHPDVQYFVGTLRMAVRGGADLDTESNRMRDLVANPDHVDAATTFLRHQQARIGRLRDPRTLSANRHERWYTGPADNDMNWPSYRALLEANVPDAVSAVDDSTNKTLSLMKPPTVSEIDTRGLVMGYVQSGKTANYIGLIAKAADVGYRFFIVLTGMLESLRRQTRQRIVSDLTSLNPQYWHQLTQDHQDFRPHMDPNAILTPVNQQCSIAVIKKNGSVLESLIRWVNGTHTSILREIPVLIIDDEADQASINTRSGDMRTPINDLIIRLLNDIPKSAYVGYTATPFANVLIDPNVPEDLYPKDFIVDLPRPDIYFGPERIFGRAELPSDDDDEGVDGLDCIRSVPEGDVVLLRPPGRDVENFEPELAGSLKDACEYFIMATAARSARGQRDRHSSMLIHTTHRAIVHDRVSAKVRDCLGELSEIVRIGNMAEITRLRNLWDAEKNRVEPADASEVPVMFDELMGHISPVLDAAKVVVENSQSDQHLDYSLPGQVNIAIGGNILSRGLTLEGLIVSYFIRSASAYDTLLQMGRWFGFRVGYSDLCRVWLTDDLHGSFRDMALVEQEIRNDVARFEDEDLTPLEFRVRIRTLPALNITSPAKMASGEPVDRSYSGRRVQTILFHHENADWLGENLEATRNLLTAAREAGATEMKDGNRRIFGNVAVDLVTEFLSRYRIHENSREMDPELLQRYIRRQAESHGSLLNWNVVIVSRLGRVDALGDIDLGLDEPVNLINRARFVPRLGIRPGTADIKALMSTPDIVADIPSLRTTATNKKHEKLIQERTELHRETGCLLIYPVSRNSAPTNDAKPGQRQRLDAVEDVIGLALVFPESVNDEPTGYVAARRYEGDDLEVFEYPEDEPLQENPG